MSAARVDVVEDPYEIVPFAHELDAVVRPPGSKSITNRALVCAALARGTSRLEGVLFADDTEAMIACLGELGVRMHVDAEAATIEVRGTAANRRSTGRCSTPGSRARRPGSSCRSRRWDERRWCSTAASRCGGARWET